MVSFFLLTLMPSGRRRHFFLVAACKTYEVLQVRQRQLRQSQNLRRVTFLFIRALTHVAGTSSFCAGSL